MVRLIPRLNLNDSSLLHVYKGLPVDHLLVSIQDVVSRVTGKPNKTFWKIKAAGGVHSFLGFDGSIVLSTVMKDELLAILTLDDYVMLIKTIAPDYCLTLDCESYEGSGYWKKKGIMELFFDGYLVANKNVEQINATSLALMSRLPGQKFIGLVKGSNVSMIKKSVDFFLSVGIDHLALHTADFFREGDDDMIAKAKHYASIIRRSAKTLTLIGFGSQKRILEFSFADNYVSFGYFVKAFKGVKLVGTKEFPAAGYTTSLVRHNLIEMIKNTQKISEQKKLGGESAWAADQYLKELHTQKMQEKEAITQD